MPVATTNVHTTIQGKPVATDVTEENRAMEVVVAGVELESVRGPEKIKSPSHVETIDLVSEDENMENIGNHENNEINVNNVNNGFRDFDDLDAEDLDWDEPMFPQPDPTGSPSRIPASVSSNERPAPRSRKRSTPAGTVSVQGGLLNGNRSAANGVPSIPNIPNVTEVNSTNHLNERHTVLNPLDWQEDSDMKSLPQNPDKMSQSVPIGDEDNVSSEAVINCQRNIIKLLKQKISLLESKDFNGITPVDNKIKEYEAILAMSCVPTDETSKEEMIHASPIRQRKKFIATTATEETTICHPKTETTTRYANNIRLPQRPPLPTIDLDDEVENDNIAFHNTLQDEIDDDSDLDFPEIAKDIIEPDSLPNDLPFSPLESEDEDELFLEYAKNLPSMRKDNVADDDPDILRISQARPPAPRFEPSAVEIANSMHQTSPQGIRMSQMEFVQSGNIISYPWTMEVQSVLRNTFKLTGFRQNQLEAINATLAGNDVLVLMPTGGGKSLCYQLPALVESGMSRGTTIVISPLIALMQDQVYHLKRRNIRAEVINSKCTVAEKRDIFEELTNGTLDLLYVSPEMLNASKQLVNKLRRLHADGRIARIVIDEAHCVSSWGHDFRPDYKLLENLKTQYIGTPIMALTATANERVRLDILRCLRQDKTVFLKQSFNRANLYYEVRRKEKTVMNQVKDIVNQFKNASGIIYCHSKNACESTAAQLRTWGISVDYYHAGLDAEFRQSVQEQWQKGQIKVICATIAFGMGIDKPDVRYVIHLTLPRNMEGYYQETGRAGRDGKPSTCIMFYNFKDAQSIRNMIDREDLEYKVKENNKMLLQRVVQYGENRTDCRKKQILQYFNEQFTSAQCNRSCDNCRNGNVTSLVKKDVTSLAKQIIGMVTHIQNESVTTNYCIEVFRGSHNRKVKSLGHEDAPGFGQGKYMEKTEVERAFHHLLAENILQEYSVYNRAGFASTYVKRGPAAADVLSDTRKVVMDFASVEPSEKRSSTASGTPSGSVAKRRKTDEVAAESYQARYSKLDLERYKVRQA